MLKAIIVEDENHSLNYLKSLLTNHCPEIEILGEAKTVDKAIKLIRQNNPDILFLDIELSGENGFTILEKLDKKIDFEIIFVTAYHQYAVRAFKFSAVSYLLKPIEIEDLLEAVSKAKKLSLNKNNDKRLEYLTNLLKQDNVPPDKLALPTNDGYNLVKICDILRFEADGSYTHIFFNNKEKVLVCKNISVFEELLKGTSFIRIHKSFMINLDYVKKFVRANGGGFVVMSDDAMIDVSVRKKKDLMEKLSTFM